MLRAMRVYNTVEGVIENGKRRKLPKFLQCLLMLRKHPIKCGFKQISKTDFCVRDSNLNITYIVWYSILALFKHVTMQGVFIYVYHLRRSEKALDSSLTGTRRDVRTPVVRCVT